MLENLLKEAAYSTPDPERALKNLKSFIEMNPSRIDELMLNLRTVSMLFSCSQFLANLCIADAGMLFSDLREIDIPTDREELDNNLKTALQSISAKPSHEHYMKVMRWFRYRQILKITLRDLLEKADVVEIMREMSLLADVIISNATDTVRKMLSETYGNPEEDAFAVIAVGKLGAEELNYSSDVDLMYVYGTETGETSGITTPHGIRKNRISNHEYYCKAGEMLTRYLSQNTENGFCYRVDLRLRPEGQRGAIAFALRGYEMYYESWGRTWERAMLLRARPIAGDMMLGNEFMKMIIPFVYRKYLDFSAIHEIRKLKSTIDTRFKRDDIKRGYGGIREIEFFAQALQLIYAGKEFLLRERSTLKVLHRLLQKGLIGQEDYSILASNYKFLRILEHRLQQVNDLQTHSLPTGDEELNIMAKKMGFLDGNSFIKDLERRRSEVRRIYDSLFVDSGSDITSVSPLFEDEYSDTELKEYLTVAGVKDAERGLRNIRAIKDSTYTFQTLRGQRLMSEILPVFIESALKTENPDAALNRLQSFAEFLSNNESYLDLFHRNSNLINLLSYVFSQSEYLSKLLITRPQNLETVALQGILRKSLKYLENEVRSCTFEGHPLNETIRMMRQSEEIRLGLLFLQKKIGIVEVIRGLSKTAEAILSVCMENIAHKESKMAIIGFGKLGGREITFNSDLDIVFVTSSDVELLDTEEAQKLLRILISYTKEGIAYNVDTRLRPDGSKGPLVSSIEALWKYYLKSAAFWELQSLLKSRPVAGNRTTGLMFLKMAAEVLKSRGQDVFADDIRQMRNRILKEKAREAVAYDIKLGPGSIEEIEFIVQYLQLINCNYDNRILVQETLQGIKKLWKAGLLKKEAADKLSDAYIFFRTLESFLRLTGENVLKRDDERLQSATLFLGFKNHEDLIKNLQKARRDVQEISEEVFR